MARFCAADADSAIAFDTLYARYKDKTWRYFCRNFYSHGRGTNEDAARDAQQELWLKLIERRQQYRAENRFAGYLFSMAHSVLIDAQRKTLRVIDAATDASADVGEVTGTTAEEPPQASHLQRMLVALQLAIAALPLQQRTTFVMYQESGMSYSDIAAATATNTETVKSRLRYARKKLTEDMRQEFGEDGLDKEDLSHAGH